MAVPNVPFDSKTKRRYNEAFDAEEYPRAKKNKCKSKVKVLYEILQNCENQLNQIKALSRMKEAKKKSRSKMKHNKTRSLSNIQISQRKDFVLRSDSEDEAIENIENRSIDEQLIWNDVHNTQTTTRTTGNSKNQTKRIQNESIDTPTVVSPIQDDIICPSPSFESEHIEVPRVTNLQMVQTSTLEDKLKEEAEACSIESALEQLFWKDVKDEFENQEHIVQVDDKTFIDTPLLDAICVSTSLESEHSETPRVTNLQIVQTSTSQDKIKKESEAHNIESAQEQLFWKDVEDVFNNQENIVQVDDKSFKLLEKEEQNMTQSLNEQNSGLLKNGLPELAVSDNDSTRLLHQTDKVICIESEEKDKDEALLSSERITPTQDIINFKIESKDNEQIPERLFWKHIDDAFDNQDNIFWKDSYSAFQNRILTGFVVNKTHIDPLVFFDDCKKMIEVKINTNFKKNPALRVNAVFCCEFKLIKDQNEIFELFYMDAEPSKIYKSDDFDCWYFEHFRDPILVKLLELHKGRNSGWMLSAIIDLKITMSRLKILQGNSYIEVPKDILLKKACVNVRNKDNACFMWAVLSALYPNNKFASRVTHYVKYKNVLNLNGIKFPMKIHQIPCFEEQNNISINVFILKLNTDKEIQNTFLIVPEYVSRKPKKSHINLLLIKEKYSEESDSEDEDSSKRNYHYIWIKNMSRLFSSQLGSKNATKLICNYCFYNITDVNKFEEHVQKCQLSYTSTIRLISKEFSLINHFSSIKKVMKKKKAPFAIYIDYKCKLKDEKQIPYSIGLYVMCTYDSSLSSYQFRRGDDCMQWFANALKDFIENVETVFVCDQPKVKLSKNDKKLFEETDRCFICEKQFTKECKKVRNNCRFTGEFRGPAHEICNMNFRDHRTISVFVHNRRENDSFLLMEYLETKLFPRMDINTQTRINKKFISFIKYSDCIIKFKFINSFELINGDLDSLASNISKFPVLQSEMSEDQCTLLSKKLIYPDDGYCSEPDRFLENSLPPISDFEDVSAQDYEHASRVWNEFKLTNFGEYSDLHLKRSVLLLVDVFEDFREKCVNEFELDPSYYHNLPDYSWDVMLRKTDVTLELLTDIEMFWFFENGTRGSLSQCLMKYSKANNASIENYNDQQQVKYLINFDATNLYEWAMCQYLPCGDFKWVQDFDGFDVESVSDESSIGYILEVDLDYTDGIHDEHKDLPFCPEYENGTLQATLNHKIKYITHYRYLKQALKSGLRLMKIHRILEFKQSAWLKPYIERNLKLNAEATNNFEKDLYERMNYCIFEYISNNLREQNKGKLVTKYEKRYGMHDMLAKREFRSIDILNDEIAYIEYKMKEIIIDRPNYLLMCVQDLAKTRIYDFHYEYMKKKFDGNCSVCYMENDSILYEIREENVYNIIKEDCGELFNTSVAWNIPHVNGKQMGLFKDKHNGRVLSEFVALRSKLYQYKFDGRNNLTNVKRSLGEKIGAKQITFQDIFLMFDDKNNLTKISHST